MRKVVVHGQVTSEEGRPTPPSPQSGLHLPRDEGLGERAVPRGFSTPVSSARVPDPRPASPQAGPLLRCNNCGNLGHLPRVCPNYGWYFPAPGKSREDYVGDRQRVQDLIARDIIREHEAHEDNDAVVVFKGARPGPERKALALQLTCTTCDRGPGDRCQTGAGKPSEPHKARLDAVDSPPPGR
jgi:hypothetical protein